MQDDMKMMLNLRPAAVTQVSLLAIVHLTHVCDSAAMTMLAGPFTHVQHRRSSWKMDKSLATLVHHGFSRNVHCGLVSDDRCSNRKYWNSSRLLSTRVFGSKAGSGLTGKIHLENDQVALENIDLDRLCATLTEIRSIIGYDTYDVSLLLIEDEEMRQTNMETRGVNAPTDILSFPFHEAVEPGLLTEPDFDIADYYTLGDLLVDVPYVIRSCQDDQTFDKESQDKTDQSDEDDRGVSGAMANEYDPERRLHMLLVHGMLHLVGYDHEEEDDYKTMVQKEEEILKALKLM